MAAARRFLLIILLKLVCCLFASIFLTEYADAAVGGGRKCPAPIGG
jgi:hypothetical protein